MNPSNKAFAPIVFREKVLREKVESIRAQLNSQQVNRLGTLIGNPETSKTKTLSTTLWALLNLLPANSMQKPHR